MNRRLVGFILVGLLTISLVACQGSKNVDAPPSDASSSDMTEQEDEMGDEDIIMGESILQWGTITSVNKGTHQIGIESKNIADTEASMKLILNTAEDTPVLDSASGEKLPMDVLKEGDEIYAWVSPAFMTSQPPQTAANVLITNIEDGTVPNYQTVESVEEQDGSFVITTLDGTKWKFEQGISLKSYPSYEDVGIETLKKGNKCLFWPRKIVAAEEDVLFLQTEKILVME
ncbi:MAG: hypothetical protein Q3993_08710 [Filifactor alocis]|nr:hypothetical protein [Filifactor alocis]